MKSSRIAGALTVAAALALPASAAAHPSVYTSTAKVESPPNSGTFVDQTRYVVANHGFTYVLRESNGIDASANRGVFDYKSIPGKLRAGKDWAWLTANGTSGAQAHATCWVAPLDLEPVIREWQGTDPFYAYVPFQKEAAGLEDDPADWIPVVKAHTGVDLSTVTDYEAACEALPGATPDSYVPADATQSTREAFNSGLIEHETAPLNAQIATLTGALTDADKAKAALEALLGAANAEIAKLTAPASPMKAGLPSARISGKRLAKRGTTVTVTGPAGAAVAVELTIGEGRARKLKLASSTLARGKATLAADGTAAAAIRPRKAVANRIARIKRPLRIAVTAIAGDRIATTTATLTR